MWKSNKEAPKYEAWQTAPGVPPALVVPVFSKPTVPFQGGRYIGDESEQSQQLQENVLLIAVGRFGQVAIQHCLSALAREARIGLSKVRLVILSNDQLEFPLKENQVFQLICSDVNQPDWKKLTIQLQTWASSFKSPRVYFCADLADHLSQFIPLLGGCLAREKEHFGSFINQSAMIGLSLSPVKQSPAVGRKLASYPQELARLRELARFSLPELNHMLFPDSYESVAQLFTDLFVVDEQSEAALSEMLFCLLHPGGAAILQKLTELRNASSRVVTLNIKTIKKEAGRLRDWVAWQAIKPLLFGIENSEFNWDGFYQHRSGQTNVNSIMGYIPNHLPFGWFFSRKEDFSNLPPTTIIKDEYHSAFAAWLRYAYNKSLASNGITATLLNSQELISSLKVVIAKLQAIYNSQQDPEAFVLFKTASKAIKVCDEINGELKSWDEFMHSQVANLVDQKAQSELAALDSSNAGLVNEFIKEEPTSLLAKFQANYYGMGEDFHRHQVSAMSWEVSDENKVLFKLDGKSFQYYGDGRWLESLHEKAKKFTQGFAINRSGEITQSDKEESIKSLLQGNERPLLSLLDKSDYSVQEWSVVFGKNGFIQGMSDRVFGKVFISEGKRGEVGWDIPRFTAVGIYYGLPLESLALYANSKRDYYDRKNINIHFCREENWARDLEIKFTVEHLFLPRIVRTLYSQNLVFLFLRGVICGLIKQQIWEDQSLAWGIAELESFRAVRLSKGKEWIDLWNAFENFMINFPADPKSLLQEELRGEKGINPFSRQNRPRYWNALTRQINLNWVKGKRTFKTGLYRQISPHQGESREIEFLTKMLELESGKDSKLADF